MLRQQLSKLAQLDQSRIWIIGEIPLRIAAQPKQLFVVGSDMGEVAVHDFSY